LIQAYSKQQLSFESDRLPALSGLASLIAERRDPKYAAGIWWKDAIYGICWRAGKHPLRKPDSYIAPSWSWASVIGPVAFQGATTSWVDLYPLNSVTFKDYGVQHRGSNKFGQVDDGWIRLEAPVASFASLTREDANGLGGGEDFIQFDFEEIAGDLWLLFLMRDERDSDAIEHRDIVDLLGIVVSRVQDLSLKKDEEAGLQKRCRAYKRVGFFILERNRDRGDLLLKRLDDLVTEVVLI
jgi:hypothetical protein